MMQEFFELLRLDAQEIQIKFLRSSIEGKGTSQEVSDFREHAVQSFVERYFPFPYKISKGGIYDCTGTRSDSIDCLILNPVHPHTIDSHGKHSLIIADGVDTAIEVKPDISVKKELKRALIQGISVKKLKRVKGSIILGNKPEYILELSRRIPFFVFSMKTKKNIDDTLNEIKDYYNQNNTPLIEQLDVVIIHNQGVLVNYKYKELFPWGSLDFSDQQKAGWVFEEWGEDTLAGFIFHLNRVYPAVPTISEPVLSKYITSSNKQIVVRSV